jgi:MFS-type transporter involved in bile tolerance (Atg22 family)
MLPVYTAHLGWGYDRLSLLLSLSTVLAVAAQVPIGYLSDRMTHRPALIVLSSFLIALFCAGIYFWQQGGFIVFILL